MEFARKGFKYIVAKDPSMLEKSTVGGDSSTVSAIGWSPKGDWLILVAGFRSNFFSLGV